MINKMLVYRLDYMDLGRYRNEIIQSLRAKLRQPLRDEDAAWAAIEAKANSFAQGPGRLLFDDLVYSLALIYADQTGLLPGFSNSDNETLFERFAYCVIKYVAPMTTQNQLKYAIRKIDPKHSAQFRHDLEFIAGERRHRFSAE